MDIEFTAQQLLIVLIVCSFIAAYIGAKSVDGFFNFQFFYILINTFSIILCTLYLGRSYYMGRQNDDSVEKHTYIDPETKERKTLVQQTEQIWEMSGGSWGRIDEMNESEKSSHEAMYARDAADFMAKNTKTMDKLSQDNLNKYGIYH